MRTNRRSAPLIVWVCSLAVLAGSAALLGFTARDVVRHITADDQPATITDVSGTGGRSMTGKHRDRRTISFRLEDGSEHAAAAGDRWFWWPGEGDTIHVYDTAAGDWKIREEFSWPRTIGYTALLLLPWIFALLKAWEWADRKARPERRAARQRAEREQRRLARKGGQR